MHADTPDPHHLSERIYLDGKRYFKGSRATLGNSGRYEPVGQSHASERGFVFVIQYGARYLHIWQTVVEGLAMRVALLPNVIKILRFILRLLRPLVAGVPDPAASRAGPRPLGRG